MMKGYYQPIWDSKRAFGKVQVTVAVEMTSGWLAQQISRTLAELKKVIKVARALGFDLLPR